MLIELLRKFQPLSEKEAKVAVKALDELKLQTSAESILGYSTLCSSDFAYSLDFFLEQLSQLPLFSKLGDMTSKLGHDCAKWVNLYEISKSSLLHKALHIDMNDYVEKIKKMNPRLNFDRYEKFTEEFNGILEAASDHCFMQNDYHLLIFQILFAQIAKRHDEKKRPFVLSEIPTGCGKSWVLAILATAIRQKYRCNVLIATSTNFLAKYGEEHYGIQFELTYNMPTNSYVSFPKLVDIVTDLNEPTFILIDEIDNFLFSNPLATRANGGCEDNIAVFKAAKLNNSNVLGVLGVTGTFDTRYGAPPLKKMFDSFFFL